MPEPSAAFDPADPMQIAVKFAQLDGAIHSMQLAQTNSNQNLATAIQGLQQEVRDLGKGISGIAMLEHDRQAHSEGLSRAFKAIAENEEVTRVTREKMLRWSAASAGASLLIGTLVALVSWIYLTDKGNNERDVDALRSNYAEHLREADARYDKIEGVLIETCMERGKPCQFR